MRVVVDTSAFYAFLSDEDPQNPSAVQMFAQLNDADADLITHQYVVVEALSLIQRRLGMAVVRRFVHDVLPAVETVWVDPDLHATALAMMLSVAPRGVSLVDWTSFIVMRKLGITTAFAFDPDFAAQGFEVIPAVSP